MIAPMTPDRDVQSRETPLTGAELIAAERERQVSEEGWTSAHDDKHRNGGLARAAACYAMPERIYVQRQYAAGPAFVDPWPWPNGDKRKHRSNFPNAIPTSRAGRLRMLIKAGALIAAEIDRLKRASDAPAANDSQPPPSRLPSSIPRAERRASRG